MLDSSPENKQLAFLGFGDLAKQILAFKGAKEDEVVIFDDHLSPILDNAHPFKDFQRFKKQHEWVIGIGYKHLAYRVELIDTLLQDGERLASFIHSSSFISPTATIEQGCMIYPMCNVDKNVSIKSGTLLNNSVIVSHDSSIDVGCYISPGVVISGHVKIGKGCFIGSGAVIANDVTIGDNVVIGAASLISKDIPDNSTVVGNPMRLIERKLNLK